MVREGELVIVDGVHGVLIVDPDQLVLAEYQLRQRELELERQKLKRIRTTPATTLDGTAVELHANIELPQDIEQVRESGATGIGLFRSEFLFLNRDDLPGEDEQFEAYRHVAQAMHGLPVTIRTLDLGADKTAERRRPRRAQSGAGLARDSPVPGRAADVPDPAARHPARLALRQDPPADSDARARARDRTRRSP